MEHTNTLCTYKVKTDSYNDRRYGKPWLAIVTDHLTKNFRFLDWNGRPGTAGEFLFDTEPGTMLAQGQKDNRKGIGGVDWYLLTMPCEEVVTTSTLADWKSNGELRKMTAEERWRGAAEFMLARALKQRLAEGPGASANTWDRVDRWCRVLGIENPLLHQVAVDFGLTPDPSAAVTAMPAAISMDAFGL